MNSIEELLNQKKSEFKQIQVPDELEVRLGRALEERTPVPGRRRNRKPGLAIALLCVIALLAVYQSDTLAFYGKQLIGYDPLMNSTLQQLNRLGKGQTIDKSYIFANGIVLTLDGIMVDDNQLLAYYSIKNPHGKLDVGSANICIKGMFSEYMMHSSQGKINDRENQIHYIASLKPPYFFEKELSFVCSLGDGSKKETGSITFILERNQAMGHTLKKELRKSVQLGGTKVTFNTIVATPTTTVIEGTLQTPLELAVDHIMHKRIRPRDLEVELIANGKNLSHQGASMSTSKEGITFKQEFDALPVDLKDLQLNVVRCSTDYDVNQQFALQLGEMKQSYQIKGQSLVLEQLYTSQGDTYLTISSEDSVVLTKVYLIMDGKRVSLEETIRDEYDKKADGTITHTRTLHFPGTGREYQLDIQRMTYTSIYDKKIVIPVD